MSGQEFLLLPIKLTGIYTIGIQGPGKLGPENKPRETLNLPSGGR